MFPFKRPGATGAILTGIFVLATTATAQTSGASQAQDKRQVQTQPSGTTTADTESGPPVTIFSKRNLRPGANRTVIGTQSASSCGFMDTTNSADDDALQQYFTEYYGDDANQVRSDANFGNTDGTDVDGADPTQKSEATRVFRDTSPHGDAASEPGGVGGAMDTIIGTTPGTESYNSQQRMTCGPSDTAFTAGRHFIAMHDHSLADAYAAFDARDYAKALGLFKASYDKMGYDVAALMEGKMYVAGLGIPRDMEKGISWLKKATQAPFDPRTAIRFNPDDPDYMNSRVDAAMTLAKIYVTGFHVPRNPKEATHWYKKADEFGFVPATHILGQIYQSGYAGEKSLTTAVTYFKKAGLVGYAPSEYELGVIYYNGGDGVPQDKKLAADWLYHAAKRGHAGALYAVGRMYDLGDVVASDPQTALVYYKEAALKGQPDAQNALGLFFYTGEIVGKDLPTARKWFIQAAQGGNADAMFNLGVMMANGDGGAKDMAMAYVWFKLAEEMGLEKAGAAVKEIDGKLTAEEKAKAEALLHPPAGK